MLVKSLAALIIVASLAPPAFGAVTDEQDAYNRGRSDAAQGR